MPALGIFRNTEIIGTTTFHRQLMIWEDLGGNLRWEMDDKLREARVEIIRIWALRESEGYFIRFVLPTWTLIIDGMMYEPELYQDINLNGRLVELKFQDYHFVFH